MIEVGFAKPGEAEAVTAVLREAAEWLASLSEPLWSPDEFDADQTRALIAAGEQLCARREGQIVGAALFQREDLRFWPDRPSREAAYLHKIAVRRDAAGSGVTEAMVDWAATEARRIGRRFLRLDCDPRPKLCALYEKLGFQFVDERLVQPFRVYRYERPV